ncbi:MAG TPA: Rab family GTPase [Vicinamibacterales bacterium]|nr:Rab family GTPase [Vicinamibacterales bacterium]
MMQKKICLLGAFAVGKTSLVSRFVHSMFSDKYLTTVGVKIEKKPVDVDGRHVDLVIWDIYGEDDFQKLRASYLRGAAGYLLVVDGTRQSTLETAVGLQATAEQSIGRVPFIMVVNKADLAGSWEINDGRLHRYSQRGWSIMRASAKTGDHVENAFVDLARAMLA